MHAQLCKLQLLHIWVEINLQTHLHTLLIARLYYITTAANLVRCIVYGLRLLNCMPHLPIR